MSFLAPLWLWAALAIAVPTVIHLLSRGRGRTVPLGTVRFLSESRSRRLRHFRPADPWRYLVRVALLASLAIALAAPRWWGPAPARDGESWVLVDPALLAARPRLEARSAEIFERLDATAPDSRRLLGPGFPTLGSAAGGGEVEAASDLWSLAAETARIAPPGAELAFFVLDRAESLRGVRPDLGRAAEWTTVADPETNRWIQRLVPSLGGAAREATEDALSVTVGSSDAGATLFEVASLSPGGPPVGGLRFENGTSSVELEDGGSIGLDDRAPPPAPSTDLRVVLDAPDDAPDAVLVVNAARAVAAHIGRPLLITRDLDPDEPADLVVEMRPDDSSPSASATASVRPATASLRVDGTRDAFGCRQSAFVEAFPDPWLDLRRCGAEPVGTARWRDGQGRPLLSLTTTADGIVHHWHGGLGPTWSSLAEAALPHLLLDLVEPGDATRGGTASEVSDRRAPVAGQSRPRTNETPPPTLPDRRPERMAWALVAALFLIDRLLARRTLGEQAEGAAS